MSVIQELTADEIDTVEGGWILLVIAAGVAIAGCVIVGYEAAHNRANQAE